MSEVETPDPAVVAAEVVKAKTDPTNQVRLSITRPKDGAVLEIYIKAPVVASVVRGMAMSNYPMEKYDGVYAPILMPHPQDPKRAVTRGAIGRATRMMVGGTDFSFAEPPRTILLANPDALEAGYTLTYKVDQPVPPDQIRKWAKGFMEACGDIISNARPFRMNWVMDRVE